VVFSEELFNKKEEEENEEKQNGKRTMLIAKRQLEEFQTEWGAKLLRFVEKYFFVGLVCLGEVFIN